MDETPQLHADCLGEILAIIHGDGGHYQAEMGTKHATEEAIAAWHARAMKIDNLRNKVAALARALGEIADFIEPHRGSKDPVTMSLCAGFALGKAVSALELDRE